MATLVEGSTRQCSYPFCPEPAVADVLMEPTMIRVWSQCANPLHAGITVAAEEPKEEPS